MHEWKFDLGAEVKIRCSGEQGMVIGRAEYVDSADQYLVRYKAADGRAVTNWWSDGALTAA